MDISRKWNILCAKLTDRFGQEIDLNGILFLIGVQELGFSYRNFTKEEKLDLIGLGTCKLFSLRGLCTEDGKDDEDWPRWKKSEELEWFSEEEKMDLLQELALEYFEDFLKDGQSKGG